MGVVVQKFQTHFACGVFGPPIHPCSGADTVYLDTHDVFYWINRRFHWVCCSRVNKTMLTCWTFWKFTVLQSNTFKSAVTAIVFLWRKRAEDLWSQRNCLQFREHLKMFYPHDPEMKTLGLMYLRSIHLQSNKKIFDVHQLPLTKYLNSLALKLCNQEYNFWACNRPKESEEETSQWGFY